MYGTMTAVSLFFTPILLTPLIGNRGCLLLGAVIYALSPLLTVFAMEASLGWVVVTYGIMGGLSSIALMPNYVVPMRWFPDHRGLVMGIVIGGYGFSSIIMTQFQLAIANPHNVQPGPPYAEGTLIMTLSFLRYILCYKNSYECHYC